MCILSLSEQESAYSVLENRRVHTQIEEGQTRPDSVITVYHSDADDPSIISRRLHSGADAALLFPQVYELQVRHPGMTPEAPTLDLSQSEERS